MMIFYKGMKHYESFHRAAQDLVRDLTRFGCGDNSCLFVKPKGMATNGGCRCYYRIEEALRETYALGVDSAAKSK